MPEDATPKILNEAPKLDPEFEEEPDNQEPIIHPDPNDTLSDTVIGFGLGALATLIIVGIANLFRR